MNDDLVVQKILKLLENNTAFIGYALNGGVGIKINVRNTETGKTVQALSLNVEAAGEVLVVKDSADNEYKAVNFKTAEKVASRVIQLRKTKPTNDKKIIEYTDSDIEIFYLFVKLIETGVPVNTPLKSTWIRKGSSCTQFVGAYERCNYAAKETIGGTSYTGLPYKPYDTLKACLDDDLGRDAKTPHGTGDENGVGLGWRIYSTKMTAQAEQNLRGALESHDANYKTNYKKLFGYGSILECSGAMYVQGWEVAQNQTTGVNFFSCDFSYLPGYTNDCSSAQQTAGYCDYRGFIGSKTPLFGQEAPGQPSLNQVDNTWGHQYGWVNLPYEFMYKRHFMPLYLNGSHAQGSFLILEGLTDDQNPTIPEGYFPWVPGCPSGGTGGPYDGSGGNRFPDAPPPPQKRDMKLSTHKAEIWLGSSKKEEAIKLYELGASDLFSGMYNGFIIKANETRVDQEDRLNRNFPNTAEEKIQHDVYYKNWNKNLIDLNIDPRVWIYTFNNYPKAEYSYNFHEYMNPRNYSMQGYVDGLYQRTVNLSVIDNKLQVIHLKLNLKPANTLSNTDCKGNIHFLGNFNGEKFSSQSWEYQKYVTIKVKDWKVLSTTNTLDTTDLDPKEIWNKDNIERKFLTSFGTFRSVLERDNFINLLSRHNNKVDFAEIVTGNHFEQYNYSMKKLIAQTYTFHSYLYASSTVIFKPNLAVHAEGQRFTALSTATWWEMWDKTLYNLKEKRLSSVVGFDINMHQVLRSSKLAKGLLFDGGTTGDAYPPYTNAIGRESYYEYLPERPKRYSPSTIRAVRSKSIEGRTAYYDISSRENTLNFSGLTFYFSAWATRWTAPSIYEYEAPPDNYYYGGYNTVDQLKSHRFDLTLDSMYGNRRFDTRRWTNGLWAQLIYDEEVKVDIDSYKDVEFKPPANPSQYIKYASHQMYIGGGYNFSQQPKVDTEIETVLSPGKLEIASKQVPIKKPTNVDLDANMSFLLYMYPYVKVTKKKKTI